MKIAILNESFLTKNHLDTLQSLGELLVYENTNSEDLAVERVKGVQVVIADCFVAPLQRSLFERVDSVKFLTLNSTGYDLVDIQAAKEQGVLVANVPAFSTEAVAEHALALLMAVNRRILRGDREMRRNPFQVDPGNQEQKVYCGFELAGKTLGIIGLGNIGTRLAHIGLALGMHVLAYTRSPKSESGIQLASLEEVLKRSDVVSLHLPFSPETEHIITKERLSLMKSSAILINTGRGRLIDERALCDALQSKTIFGAGLDLIDDWSGANPLLRLDNVVFTPHIGFYTNEALQNCADIIVRNIRAFVSGRPVNVINH